MTDYIYKRQDSYTWFNQLDERQRKEIEYNKLYDSDLFRHGTDGHNLRIVCSVLSKKLNEYEDMIDDYKKIDGENEELRDELEIARSGLDEKVDELESSNRYLSDELESANDRIKELEILVNELESQDA